MKKKLSSTQIHVIETISKWPDRYVRGESSYRKGQYEVKDGSFNTVMYFRKSTFNVLLKLGILVKSEHYRTYYIHPKCKLITP